MIETMSRPSERVRLPNMMIIEVGSWMNELIVLFVNSDHSLHTVRKIS